MKYKNNITLGILSVFMMLNISCSDSDKTEILIKNKKISSILVKRLKIEQIPFNLSNKHVFEISKLDKEKFTELYRDIFSELMPVERTHSLPAKTQPEIEKALKANGYNYKKMCFKNRELIILDKKNFKKADKLLDDINIEVIEKLALDASKNGSEFTVGEFTKCDESRY